MDSCQSFVCLLLLLATIHTHGSISSEQRSARSSSDAERAAKQADLHREMMNVCNGTYLKKNGTTCGLREIMIGRCYDFQYVKRGLFLSNQTQTKNCSELYDLFESSVRFKPFCDMNMSTYDHYFQRALQGVHVINRAIFWSGTYAIAHAYSGRGTNFITLEDTLAAGMADGLTWCGKQNDTEGFDYVMCPNTCKDNRWADMAFWGLASKTFAQRVAGEIFVILNGSRTDGRPSFRDTSYFALFELPSFQRSGPYPVTKVNVLLLHSPDQAVVERCGEKSLIVLENLVRDAQFAYSCTDDPDDLILMMCGDAWSSRECLVARNVLRQTWKAKLNGTAIPTLNGAPNANSLSAAALFLMTLLFHRII